MAHRVFICHSSKDKFVADAVCVALEERQIGCWIAPRDIHPGVEYGKAIVDALSGCDLVVLIFSKHANDSPQVRREIERAVSKLKTIVPLQIGDTLPSDAMEYALSNTQWLSATDPPNERHLRELCSATLRLIEPDESSPHRQTRPGSVKSTSAVQSSKSEQQKLQTSNGLHATPKKGYKFLIFAVLFGILWIAAFTLFHVAGLLLHLLLIFAVISLIMHFVSGRR